ncbi:hypoxanthine-guanine phosphoribosyltransferase [Tulasnella sp. JGI-2019a]|nr:hypoxanthine-guanine phosphoribosyltransferase [Tulasnella sp. JGI-2019a]KAG9018384.1 hypoxanthine-guanine phosphoribosyltransferase [Tulasnella sp. JGI-2019a]KAG9037565.1 hypoxanthine-guanine phosphoribosyltransferase [Tulasnella sp. JGI-2019a]
MADGHLRATYDEIHMTIGKASDEIAAWKPDLFIAIGGGGFFPARVLRSFVKHPTTGKNISIQAIGLSLYEEVAGISAECVGKEVVRTQWLGPESRILLGRRCLIIDEVDDSRTTLAYAVAELQRDVEEQLKALPEAEREAKRTKFAVFVVHNKLKPKAAELPANIPYFTGEEIEDRWFDYPWEAKDIYEHDRLAAEGKALRAKH